MELFAKIVNGQKPLTISAESSIIDVRLGSKYVSVSVFSITIDILLGKKVSQEKKLGKRFGKTSPNKLLSLPKLVLKKLLK